MPAALYFGYLAGSGELSPIDFSVGEINGTGAAHSGTTFEN
jgi:hypothetical protein